MTIHSQPSVSVIIPTYNASQYLAEAIDSVLAQTAPADEIIVVNDGSQDDTATVVRDYGNRIQYIEQINSGPSVARNSGIAIARGEWVAFLDSDDVWLSDKLATQWRAVEQVGSPALICGATITMDANAKAPHAEEDIQLVPLRRLLLRNQISTSTVMVPKAELLAVGGFDPRYRGPEDYACWLELAKRIPVWRDPQPLSRYRITPNSLSQQIQRMRDQELDILQRFLTSPNTINRCTRQQIFAGVHLRAAIMFAEVCQRGATVRELLYSWQTWPFSLEEYSAQTSLVRSRMLLRVLINR